MMKEHYVTYAQAVKLKELGFDWKCICFYSAGSKGIRRNCSHANFNSFEMALNGPYYEMFSAPRLDQAAAWLREVKGVDIVVEPRFSNYTRIGYDWFVHDDCSNDYALRSPLPFSETYESVLSDGISGALELLINNG